MSNQTPSSSIIDKKFILTMVLVLGCWLGWQSYMSKKYPSHFKANVKKDVETESVHAEQNSKLGAIEKVNGSADELPKSTKQDSENIVAVTESLHSYEDQNIKFDISSRGMAIKNVSLKKYRDRQSNPITFSVESNLSLFGTSLVGRREPIDFKINKTSDFEIIGEAQVDGMKITKIFHINPDTYSINTKVRAVGLSDTFTGFVTGFSEKIIEYKGGSFLMPQFEHQEFYVNHDGENSRTVVSIDTPQAETYVQTKIAGFGSQYFAVAVLDKSPVIAEFKASTVSGAQPTAVGLLTHNLLNKSDQFAIEYVSFIGPKSFETLKAIDADMTNLVNLGFFMSIAKAILWLMKLIYSAIGNWGIAIIFLTIIVRIIVLPFNLIGYKQMKAMTKIQPAMKALREKYKGDPQKLNQEMLVLMKEAKANPLGGCLPMLLQIPIFFALYQVIGQSIDLYQAPFMLWITDLSLKDPFYVLPILMGVTMFIQQKITPNTMEPAQQKIMLFMPIFFTFLMVTLPSGLTLYIFISSVFGVLQQLYFMRDNNPALAGT